MVLSRVARFARLALFLLGAVALGQSAVSGAQSLPQDQARLALIAAGVSAADLCGDGPGQTGHDHCQSCLSFLAALPVLAPDRASPLRRMRFAPPPDRAVPASATGLRPRIRAPPVA